MTLGDLRTLMPLLILGGASVVLMLVIAFKRSHLLAAVLASIGLTAALAVLFLDGGAEAGPVTRLILMDGFGSFFMGLIIVATLPVVLLSYGFFRGRDSHPEEFYLLVLLGTLGAGALTVSTHFVSFFLALEILSISLYALLAYPRLQQNRVEAGLKYLILGGVSSAFLLFGMALVYAASGTMEFASLVPVLAFSLRVHSWLFLAGLGLVVVGIGFKLALVPFHLWTPDVYEGAPAPATAYVATVSKGAVFALLLRFLGPASAGAEPLLWLFGLIAIASMVLGNLLALLQTNVKRILAYSSIAHAGYLLVAFLASGEHQREAVAFYLCAYIVTTLGAFGVVALLSGVEREAESIEDYRGLFWRRPWLAGTFTAMLLSLAGIPATAGFIGKFYVVLAGVGSSLWLLVITLVFTSVIGLFYYLRVIAALYGEPWAEAAAVTARPTGALSGQLAISALALALLWLGIYPAPILSFIHAMLVPLS